MQLTISKKIPTGGGDEKNEKLIIIKEPINPLIYSNVRIVCYEAYLNFLIAPLLTRAK